MSAQSQDPTHDASILTARFHPVWHTKNNLITGYRCVLTRDGRTASGRDFEALMGEPVAEAARAKADALNYGGAVKAARYLMLQNMKALLIVPVHYSTVDRLRHMPTLLEAGGDGLEEAKELLVFELIDLPPNLTRARLQEPVSYLRTRSRALIAGVGFKPGELLSFKELGFHGISASVADYNWKESDFLKSFEQFAIGAEKARLQSFVHAISSTSLAVAAVGAGITYMDGEAISEPVDSPSRIRPFEIDMLFEG